MRLALGMRDVTEENLQFARQIGVTDLVLPLPDLDGAGMPAVGPFFGLEARYLSNGEPAQLQPGLTYSMVVRYQPQGFAPGVDEDDLSLYSWSVPLDALPGATPQWKLESSHSDVEGDTIDATPSHFSVWGLLGKDKVYLPVVLP